jgi:hypothetical protein
MLFIAAAACSSKAKEEPTAGNTGSAPPAGSAEPVAKGTDTGMGSGMAGSGSAMAGSAAAGSGAGSGSAMAAGSGEGGGSGWDFDKLTHEEKMDFMKKQVVPTMKPLFQDFDKKKYANFGCKTCHGKDPAKAKYKMPNPELPKLDFAALKAGKQAPKVAEFMGKTVKPQMAKLLQQPEFTETNPKGFGCLECHEQKK